MISFTKPGQELKKCLTLWGEKVMLQTDRNTLCCSVLYSFRFRCFPHRRIEIHGQAQQARLFP
jgi:hypothetical protein